MLGKACGMYGISTIDNVYTTFHTVAKTEINVLFIVVTINILSFEFIECISPS